MAPFLPQTLSFARALSVVLIAALAAAAAGDDALKAARRALEAAIAARDAARARDAVHEVAAEGSEKAAKLIVAAAGTARDLDVYADFVDALGSFRAPEAVSWLAETAKKHDDWTVRYLLVEALAEIDLPPARAALFGAYDDRHEAVAACAIRACGAGRLKAAVTPLIDKLERLEKQEKKKEDKEERAKVHVEARRALEAITRQSFSSAGDWRRWWAENEAKFEAAPAEPKEGADDVVTRVRERGDGEYVERIGEGDIFVVKGQHDECEAVLDVLKLPYTLLERPAMKAKLPALDPKAVVVFNCEGNLEDAIKGDEAKALASFVDRGGYVFSSDWAIGEEVMPAFPGMIGIAQEMPQEPFDVRILPSKGVEKHPLLRNVFPDNPYEAGRMHWTIDDQAYTFTVGKGVVPLVESPDLASKGGPVVACTFRAGKGAVLHVLGHFKMQKDKSGDGFALQQLLVNFIVEKQKFRAKASKKGK